MSNTISSLFRPANSVCWNVFLALVPIALGWVLSRIIRQSRRIGNLQLLWSIPVGAVWLLFLPNTCYLLSEWRHYLTPISATPIIYRAQHDHGALFALLASTLFYVTYSGTGMISFVLSIWPVEHAIRSRGNFLLWPYKVVFFWLCSLGVYLGLVKRSNSWDIFTSERASELLRFTKDAFTRPELFLVITAFGLVLWCTYWSFDIWVDGFQHRFGRARSTVN